MLCAEIAEMSKGKAIAYVDLNEENYRVNAYGEKIVANRGRNARTFRSEKDALDWLLKSGIKD